MANHSSEHNLLFKASTPLGFSVYVTHSCWKLIVTVKHPVMAEQESEVQDTLENPDEIRLSRSGGFVRL